VDGPPNITDPHARLPALPLLFDMLPKSEFDLILDDYNRTEEKEIAEKWKELLTEKSVNYTETVIPLLDSTRKCFVAFPYLVMPDVITSTIRGSRKQDEHACRMKGSSNY
jgi:hypothetical protein